MTSGPAKQGDAPPSCRASGTESIGALVVSAHPSESPLALPEKAPEMERRDRLAIAEGTGSDGLFNLVRQ